MGLVQQKQHIPTSGNIGLQTGADEAAVSLTCVRTQDIMKFSVSIKVANMYREVGQRGNHFVTHLLCKFL